MMISTIIRNKTKNKKLNTLFSILFWIVIWEVLALVRNNGLILPTPIQTFKAMITLIVTDGFITTVSLSIYRVIVGFILSLFIGFAIGLVSGLFNPLYNLLSPIIIAMKSTPVVSVIIIAILWFSSSNVPIFVAFLMCFPIIYTNTVEGIRHVDHKLIEMAAIFKVSKQSVIKNIYIPSIKPYILTGIKNTLGLSWKVTVASEVLSSPKFAIGHDLYDAKIYLESEQVFAWTVIIITLSFLFEYSVKFFVNKLSY